MLLSRILLEYLLNVNQKANIFEVYRVIISLPYGRHVWTTMEYMNTTDNIWKVAVLPYCAFIVFNSTNYLFVHLNLRPIISIQGREDFLNHCKIWHFIALPNPKIHVWNFLCSYAWSHGHMPYKDEQLLMEKIMPRTCSHPFVHCSLRNKNDIFADAWIDTLLENVVQVNKKPTHFCWFSYYNDHSI